MTETNTATVRTATSVHSQLRSVKPNAVKNFFKLSTAIKKKEIYSAVMHSDTDYHQDYNYNHIALMTKN